MSQPTPVVLDLTAAQYLELEKFFEHVKAEADAGRPGMLVAQVGYPNRSKMRVGFLPHDKAKQFAVPNGWHVEMKPPQHSGEHVGPT
jgi:hypothetical protein